MLSSLYLANTFAGTSIITKVQFLQRTLPKKIKSGNSLFCKYLHSSSNHLIKTKCARQKVQYQQSDLLNANTNVQNNVLLYKYEKPYLCIQLRLVLIGFVFFGGLLTYSTYTPRWKSISFQNDSWSEIVKKCGFEAIIFAYAIIIVPAVISFLLLMAKRLVKYIILSKGGKDLCIVTYHIRKGQNIITVPAENVKSGTPRENMKNYIPLKIRGQKLFYLVDAEGIFVNPLLYDSTVGIAKNW